MFVITTDVPKTGTLTNIDKLIMSSLITILLCAIACVAIFFITQNNLTTLDVNMFFALGLVILYVFSVYYTVIRPAQYQRGHTPHSGEISTAFRYVTLEDIQKRSIIHADRSSKVQTEAQDDKK